MSGSRHCGKTLKAYKRLEKQDMDARNRMTFRDAALADQATQALGLDRGRVAVEGEDG